MGMPCPTYRTHADGSVCCRSAECIFTTGAIGSSARIGAAMFNAGLSVTALGITLAFTFFDCNGRI